MRYFQLIFVQNDEELTETLDVSYDVVTSVSRNVSVDTPSSLVTECQLTGRYSFGIDGCIELLQPKAVNCSGIPNYDTIHAYQCNRTIIWIIFSTCCGIT